MNRQPVFVEPLGTGSLMPAILLGVTDAPLVGVDWPASAPAVPRWFASVLQQAGGYAMSYPSLAGLLLRLEANADHARQPIDRLVRGFHHMAEDPALGILSRDFPNLRGACGTWGESLDAEQLDGLNRELATHFDLPRLTSGLEACVSFESSALLTIFEGWRLVEFAPGVSFVETDQPSPGSLWTDRVIFDVDVLRELEQICAWLRPKAPLEAVLLWENSD